MRYSIKRRVVGDISDLMGLAGTLEQAKSVLETIRKANPGIELAIWDHEEKHWILVPE